MRVIVFFIVIPIIKAFKPESFLLLADSDEGAIYKLNLTTLRREPLYRLTVFRPIAVGFDYLTNGVYWTDVKLKAIRVGDLHGNYAKTVRTLERGSVTDGLTIDSLSRLIFYTDTTYKGIFLLTIDGLYRKTIIYKSLDQPRAIISDSNTGTIYWTDWGATPKIETSNYDGSERRDVITTDLVWPNGLAIDFKAAILYWCDGKTGRIEKSKLDGTNRMVVSDQSRSGARFFGLALHETTLYYTDWAKRYLMKMSTSGGSLAVVESKTFEKLSGVYLYDGDWYSEETNACAISKGGCSHFCFPRPKYSRKCACPDNMFLTFDMKNCNYREPLRILMLGKSGVGKSTTGNAIVGKEVFETSPASTEFSLTSKTSFFEGISLAGQFVRVVDTPGLFGTLKVDPLVLEIYKAIRISFPGPHIILFVTRVGSFTLKDTSSLATYKRIFGTDIEKYLIVVFTGKEILMENGINIHDYVQSLSSDSELKQLLHRCNNRYVAFSDTGDVFDQRKNVDKLLDIAGRLMLQRLANPYFTNDIYEAIVKLFLDTQEDDESEIEDHEKLKYTDT
ncbi:low-density lipoprotein receptor-related protein 4-like isoform X2 [Ostrea edulis]|nr:low-density lipoprotein receptor-related protein 4-like isoform X2 [Ostrea edulis]